MRASPPVPFCLFTVALEHFTLRMQKAARIPFLWRAAAGMVLSKQLLCGAGWDAGVWGGSPRLLCGLEGCPGLGQVSREGDRPVASSQGAILTKTSPQFPTYTEQGPFQARHTPFLSGVDSSPSALAPQAQARDLTVGRGGGGGCWMWSSYPQKSQAPQKCRHREGGGPLPKPRWVLPCLPLGFSPRKPPKPGPGPRRRLLLWLPLFPAPQTRMSSL